MTLEARYVPLSQIHIDPEFNCRSTITPASVKELSADIKENGIIQPVVVAPMDDGRYKLIAGFRRCEAAKQAELTEVPAVIRHDMTDPCRALIFNLAENIQRKELSIVEEAFAIKRLREMGLGREAVAHQVKKGSGWVQTRFMVLDLPEEIYPFLNTGLATQPHIRDLYAIYQREGKEKLFEAVRLLKNASINGQKPPKEITKKFLKQTGYVTARIRSKAEIVDMNDRIRDKFGACLATRALAWASGYINDTEMEESLEDAAKGVL